MTARETLEQERPRIEAALSAIAAGLDKTRARPDEAVKVIAKAAETDDTKLVRAELDAVLPIFADGLVLDRAVLERMGGLRGAHRAREDASPASSTPSSSPSRAGKTGLSEAPGRCHRPGCRRSMLVAASRASGAAEPSVAGYFARRPGHMNC